MSPKRAIRIGVVGLGRMGQIHLEHLRALPDLVEVTGICDHSASILDSLGKKFGVPTHRDFAALLDKAKPHAVIIATPPASHPSLISLAATSGAHIFCEKPLALTRKDAAAVARALDSSGVLFQIAFQRRFDRAYRHACARIRAGEIGDPITFKAVARDAGEPNLEYARPEVSGGLLLDMAIHDFDLARWLMASEVSRVSTEANNLLYPQLATVGDVDNAVVNLTFRSGAIGNVEASRTGTYGYDIRTEVVGTRGALYIGNIQDDGVLVAGRDGFQRKAVAGFADRFADSYRLELADFVRCVLDGRPPECGLRDAALSLDIAVAATESLRSGAPVELPPIA